MLFGHRVVLAPLLEGLDEQWDHQTAKEYVLPIGGHHWVQEGMVSELREFRDESGQLAGLRFTVTNQFFHAGKPLGWFREVAVEVDGQLASAGATTITLNGQRFPISAVPTLSDVWWGPLQPAEFEVRDASIRSAAEHRVALLLEFPLVTFNPVLDRNRVYPTNPARLEAVLTTTEEAC